MSETPAEPVLTEEVGLDHVAGDDSTRRPRRAPRPPADGRAVAALVLSLVGLHVLGVILGHVALARIRRTGAGGRGMAIAGLVLGYTGLVLALVWWTVYFSVIAPLVTLPG
ncbi:DUF4190 domain-containing protein [Naasia aerilata]|uniref:DUF4190 domain-containing protein n=1 Tax=Naasia aerilata TaxID=1162966 RepID=A0ABM8G9U5_9MICO|nr:DUF4190 domain-containing protein [Naasia aerilata]BDZ44982.1 hypothetical protein GCM10025866_08910 [Naasia aerilata]